jgi:hypothetical protein
MRFSAMFDLQVVVRDTDEILMIFWTARKVKGRARPGDSAAKLLKTRRAGLPANIAKLPELLRNF